MWGKLKAATAAGQSIVELVVFTCTPGWLYKRNETHFQLCFLALRTAVLPSQLPEISVLRMPLLGTPPTFWRSCRPSSIR